MASRAPRSKKGRGPGRRSGSTRRAARSGLLYVLHEHDARTHHFDLRLEAGGVLLSWAVPKGLSLDPAEKRLAVRVEDHPLAYGDFEGEIPEGHYGAGEVRIADRGTWVPEGDPARRLAAGKLEFEILGGRFAGPWVLVRMRRAVRLGPEHWLLIRRTTTSRTGTAPRKGSRPS